MFDWKYKDWSVDVVNVIAEMDGTNTVAAETLLDVTPCVGSRKYELKKETSWLRQLHVEMWVKRHPLDRPGNGRRAHRQIPPAT